MNKNSRIYIFINMFVLLLAAVLFVCRYVCGALAESVLSLAGTVVLVATVLAVHLIKALRLYLALYGNELSRTRCLKLYCKITPVGVILPWKLGDLFRVFCCGAELSSFMKGLVIILIDRFFDTCALLSLMLFVWLLWGGVFPALAYVFLIFLGIVLLVYIAFPGIYAVWKHNLLVSRASARRLSVLRILDTAGRIYQELKLVLHGRGSLLYLLSLLAWGVEIGSLYFLRGNEEAFSESVAAYLSSALGMGAVPAAERFVFYSVILLLIVYLVLKLCELPAALKESRK